MNREKTDLILGRSGPEYRLNNELNVLFFISLIQFFLFYNLVLV